MDFFNKSETGFTVHLNMDSIIEYPLNDVTVKYILSVIDISRATPTECCVVNLELLQS